MLTVASSVQPLASVTNSVAANGSTDRSISAVADVVVAVVAPGITLLPQLNTYGPCPPDTLAVNWAVSPVHTVGSKAVRLSTGRSSTVSVRVSTL